MPLLYSEEHTLLRESAKGFFNDHAPVSAFRALRDNPNEQGYDPTLWQSMAEMGFTAITVPEEYGGLGSDYVALGVLMEEMGRHLTVTPLLSTVVLAATTLVRAGNAAQKDQWLGKITSAQAVLAMAIDEGNHHCLEQTTFSAEQTADGFILNGDKTLVLDGHIADAIIILARTRGKPGDSDGLSLFLVDTSHPDLNCQPLQNMDSRNAATLQCRQLHVGADALLGELHGGYGLLQSVLHVAQVALSAELLGICRQVFETTLAYLNERKQFGVAIGSFQALQHRMAKLFCEIELCHSVVLKALQAIDQQDPQLPQLASLCKAKLCETAKLATNEAIQLHGGIGMTDELDMGFYLKRARSAQQTFGDYSVHIDRYARLSGF